MYVVFKVRRKFEFPDEISFRSKESINGALQDPGLRGLSRAEFDTMRDSGSVGGVRPCQGRGRGFESRLSLNKKRSPLGLRFLLYNKRIENPRAGSRKTPQLPNVVKATRRSRRAYLASPVCRFFLRKIGLVFTFAHSI